MHEPIRQTDLPSVAALAYLGDAVYSYRIRRSLVLRGISHADSLNRESLRYVTAEAQSALYLRIEPSLAEDERDVARRAMNSGHLNRRRHTGAADYRRATALEAILGMLDYLGDGERIDELFRLFEEQDGETPAKGGTLI